MTAHILHTLTVLSGVWMQSLLLLISEISSSDFAKKKKKQNKENPVNTFLSSGFPKEKGECSRMLPPTALPVVTKYKYL